MGIKTSKSGRIELKCKLPFAVAHKLLDLLGEICTPDRHGPLGGYQISSIYFDDELLSAYHAKLWGIDLKEKHRLRFYNGEQTIYAEAKCKKDKTVFKARQKLKCSTSDKLVDICDEIRIDDSLPILSSQSKGWGCKNPVALVSYFRKAYFWPSPENLRLTVDLGVASNTDLKLDRSPQDMAKNAQPIDPEWCIFEIKSSGPCPRWLLAVMRGLDIQVETFSKYTYSLDHSHLGKRLFSETTTGV